MTAICALAATVLGPLLPARAAPTSIYNGTSFTSAPTTPTGGGQSVSRDGAYTFSVPIVVPPGRLSQTPSLALNYRSDGPIYGTIAAGWSLDLPTISLDTSNGVLQPERRYVTGLAGGEVLVPSNDPVGPNVVATFRARRDVSNTRYEMMSPASPFQWQVKTPDGGTLRFGRRDGDAPVDRLSLLAESADAHDNTIVYDWSWQRTAVRPSYTNVWTPRLDQIRYTSNPTANLAPSARVAFTYETKPGCTVDSFPIGSQLTYRNGAPLLLGRDRLSSITTYAAGRTVDGGAVREYQLLYDADQARCDRDGGPTRRLTEIRTTGWSPEGNRIAVPPMTFGYEAEAGHRHELWTLGARESGALHREKWGMVDTMLTDMDGDGLPDRLVSEGGETCDFYWQRNTGAGFDDARNHVRRPRLPYGAVPADWEDPDGASDDPVPQRCSLTAQRTLYVNAGSNLEPDCRQNGHHVRTASYVNWRFMDVDHDGLLDMVAGVDANIAGVDARSLQFEGVSWDAASMQRKTPGTFVFELLALELEEGTLPHPCQRKRPVILDARFPWIVFRNEGGGRFAVTPEVVGMPVPLVSSRRSSRTKLGSKQVGDLFDELVLSDMASLGGTYSKSADPFSFVDVDADGYMDIVSSKKSTAELNGGEPETSWRVFRGIANGLFEGRGGKESPYLLPAPVRSHANGAVISASLVTGQGGVDFIRSTSATSSGAFEVNGDGLPDFVWTSVRARPHDVSDWETAAFWLPNQGASLLPCNPAESCALTLSPQQRVGDGAVIAMASRDYTWNASTAGNAVDPGTWWSGASWHDVDGDGRQDLIRSPVSLLHLLSTPSVRYSDGATLLPSRPLPAAVRLGTQQVEVKDPEDAAATVATRMAMDINGDGVLDSLSRHDVRGDTVGEGLPDTNDPRTWSVLLSEQRPSGKLTRITNGRGGTTKIEYASVRNPVVVHDWKLPMHHWVTYAVTVDAGDGSPAQVTRYEYGEPIWNRDDEQRYGFRGFAFFATSSPVGSRTESRIRHAQYFAGLPWQTVTYELVGGVPRPRSIATTEWRDAGEVGAPLFVQTTSDVTACREDDVTVAQCSVNGATLRTTSAWQWLEAPGSAVRLLLPKEEIVVAGTDPQAVGAQASRHGYAYVVTGTDYRVRATVTTDHEKTADGWRETQFKESIYGTRCTSPVFRAALPDGSVSA